MSADFAQMLTEKRANAWEQGKAILDKAAAEKRDLTVEEQTAHAQIGEDLNSLRDRIAALVKSDEDNAAIEASLRKLGDRPQVVAPPAAVDAEATALRSFLRGEARSLEVKASQSEIRSLVKGTATAGGNTVPTSFYGRLWAHMILTANLINAGATVWHTDSGENMQVPKTTAHGGAALVAEGGAIAASDPTFGQASIGAYKYGVLIQVARELLTDTAVDLEGYLAMQAGRAVGNAFGTDLISGNGTAKPTGILNNTTLGATSTVGKVGAPQFDDLIALFYSVISPYRNAQTAGWLFNDLTAGGIRTLKDTTGRYLWEPALTVGAPDTILGKPVYTDPNVPVTALNAKSVIFGDLSAYLVRMVNGIRFEQSLEYAFNTDLVTFRCLVRGDGILVDQTGAVKHLVGAAS